MRGTSLLDANLLEMGERYRQGETMAALAGRYHVCGHTIKKRLTQMGIGTRSTYWYSPMNQNGKRRHRIVAEYAAGATTYDLAAKYNVTRPTICNWFRAWGVARRKLSDYYPGGPLFIRGDNRYLATTDRSTRTICYIHRACWEAYWGMIPKGYVVHHVDGDKLNNEIENLQCMTRSEHSSYHHTERQEAAS